MLVLIGQIKGENVPNNFRSFRNELYRVLLDLGENFHATSSVITCNSGQSVCFFYHFSFTNLLISRKFSKVQQLETVPSENFLSLVKVSESAFPLHSRVFQHMGWVEPGKESQNYFQFN